ncbi:DUF6233 domain-containing protein [Streptomyces sp. NPDC053560]|uniref:DUF6233 domain-containing protein n=1 Tax=Streptomyces sp. NPDC053560 TaxID=3365711 RepID=UPI0037D65A46
MDEDPGPLADGELPSEPPTPPIRIVLHDGQELVGRLLRRWQGNTTAWFYEVSVTLWPTRRSAAGTWPSRPTSSSVPRPPMCGPSTESPMPGCPSSGTARRCCGRAPAAGHPLRPPRPPLPVRDRTRGWGSGGRWSVSASPTTPTSPAPVRVHRAGCPLCKARADLTTAQAQAALEGPAADACKVCGAAARLQELRT